MVRLKDIAAQTGLSVNTVSLALRGSPRIAQDTRDRVRSAADALDYLPNHIARALVRRRTGTVGLLLTDVTSPLLTQVARSVEQELKALGYVTLLAASNDDPEEEIEALATFRARQVDGMLVYPADHREVDAVRRLRQAGLPVVLLAGEAEGAVDVVRIDERAGAFKAVRHLAQAGHRRIGLIDGARRHGNAAKSDGYLEALRQAGLAPTLDLMVDPLGHSVGHGHDAFARLMGIPDPPTAVLADNDRLALGGLRWCQTRGVAVPGDLAIFGYDDIEYSAYASTPLSSVNYPVADLARQAVARLQVLIEARDRMPPAALDLIEPELVLRASTERHRRGS